MKNVLTTITLASLIASQGQAMVVHEWGTFTSVQGSNGKDQIGAYHEDEKLPDFVHGFGQIYSPTPSTPDPDFDPGCFKNIHCRVLQENRITQRMETPVIYFYHDGDSPQSLSINVRFPEGVISETYPAPTYSFPDRTATILRGGEVDFDFEVQPLGTFLGGKLPPIPEGNIYGHARNVDSNLVTVGAANDPRREVEKFIFYRGVGTFRGPLQASSFYSIDGESMTRLRNLNQDPKVAIRKLIAIHVDDQGRAAYQFLGTRMLLGGSAYNFANDNVRMAKRVPIEELKSAVETMLVESGLFDAEAKAMVNTWEHGYFNTPGLRFLYVLPKQSLEEILPMTITSKVDALTRVMVGRLEVLPQDEEVEILNMVANLGPKYDFKKLGRFAEPKLRAVFEYALTTPASPQLLNDLEGLIEAAKNYFQ